MQEQSTNERFEEWCIRTGHKLVGHQGVDGSRYQVMLDGTVQRLSPDVIASGLRSAAGGAGSRQ